MSDAFLIAVASAMLPLKAPQAPQRDSKAERGLIPFVFEGEIGTGGIAGVTGMAGATGWRSVSGRILMCGRACGTCAGGGTVVGITNSCASARRPRALAVFIGDVAESEA